MPLRETFSIKPTLRHFSEENGTTNRWQTSDIDLLRKNAGFGRHTQYELASSSQKAVNVSKRNRFEAKTKRLQMQWDMFDDQC